MSDAVLNLKRQGLCLESVHSPNIEHSLRRLLENLPAAERKIFERLLAEEKAKAPEKPKDQAPGNNSSAERA
jgi:hypothetical protein